MEDFTLFLSWEYLFTTGLCDTTRALYKVKESGSLASKTIVKLTLWSDVLWYLKFFRIRDLGSCHSMHCAYSDEPTYNIGLSLYEKK